MELVDLKDFPVMLHDNLQAVTCLFFVGVRDHAEDQPVMDMKRSVVCMMQPVDMQFRELHPMDAC